MPGFFEVTDREISSLDQVRATELFKELLRSEAQRIGLPFHALTVSTWVLTPDGGVDAKINLEGNSPSSNIITSNPVAYQIKTSRTGDSFSPTRKSHLKEELFGSGKNATLENLGAEVRSCLEAGGDLVFVCFAHQLNPQSQRKSEQMIKELLEEAGITNPTIRVWGINHLTTFITPFPSIALGLKNLEGQPLRTWKSWHGDSDMGLELVKSPDYEEKQQLFMDRLMTGTSAVHLRVVKEAGAGKSRFVHEVVSSKEISPLVVYSTATGLLEKSHFMDYLSQEDNAFEAVLIVDECDQSQAVEIWNKLKNKGKRIRFVSIFNRSGNVIEDTQYVELPDLGQRESKEIIEQYGVRDDLEKWARLAEGSPRFAHLIGFNLREYPTEVLRPVENIIERMIAGYEDPQSPLVLKRKACLLYISLFKRFGYLRGFNGEAKKIWEYLYTNDSNISWDDFRRAVADLQDLKILQGEGTLYISPAGFHIRMWIDWWENYGDDFNLEEFWRYFTDGSSLLSWFYEMFEYADQSQAAKLLIERLLQPGGLLESQGFLKKKQDSRFFTEIAKINPDLALNFLERSIGKLSKKELLESSETRRDTVWALEYLAIPKHLFDRASRLLLKLAEAETEKGISNNATGVFIDLFSMGWGQLAPTEAPPQMRMSVLRDALLSDNKDIRSIGVRAASKALQARNIMRDIGTDEGGLNKRFERWNPKKWGEIFDGYSLIWDQLVKTIEEVPDDEKKAIAEVLIDHIRDIGSIQVLHQKIITTFQDLIEKNILDKAELLKELVIFLHYDKKEMMDEVITKWEDLKESLSGKELPDLLERYVALDLLEDKYDEDGKPLDESKPLILIARQLLKEKKILEESLNWLVTTKAKNGFLFGYNLAAQDKKFSILNQILNAQKTICSSNSKDFLFLSGYLKYIFETKQEFWTSAMEQIANDKIISPYFVEIIWRSGVTNNTVLRAIELARQNIVPVKEFSLFGYGSVIRDLNEDVFLEMIGYLNLTNTLESIVIALDLVQYYYIGRKAIEIMPQHPVLDILVSPLLTQPNEKMPRYQMLEHNWTDIAKHFIKKYPENSIEIATFALSSWGNDDTIFDRYNSSTQEVVNEVIKTSPKEIWAHVKKYLIPPINEKSFRIQHWLEGHRFSNKLEGGALRLFPHDIVFDWVNEDPNIRAIYLAEIVPQDIYENGESIALELLKQYGSNSEVRKALMSSYLSEGWSGPQSLHYEGKKRRLLALKENVDNPNVQLWINEFITYLDKVIKRSLLEEERNRF